MATAETTSETGSTDSNEQDYPFTAILSEEGVSKIDMVLRHISMVDEFRLRITDEGWNITVVDAANIMMVDVHFPTTILDSSDESDGPSCSETEQDSMFESYQLDEDMTVGVDRGRFQDALEGGRTVKYGFNPDGSPFMTVGGTDIEPIDPDSIRMEPDVPDLDLPSTVVIKDIEEVNHFISEVPSNHVQFSCSSKGLALHADGDADSASYLLSDGDGCDVKESTSNGTSLETHERIQEFHNSDRYARMAETDVSKFSQDYLENMFTKLLVKHVRDVSYEIRLGTQFPIMMERQDDTDVEMTVMIAPRISSE